MSISEIALRRRILLVLHKIRKIAAEKHSPRWIIFASDALISVIGVLLGYLIRFSFHTADINYNHLVKATIVVLSIRVLYSIIFKIYAHVIRYTSIHDIKRVFSTV